MKKKIAILGSTGFIGKSLLDIISKDRKNFEIILLTTNKNYKKLLNQARLFNVINLIVTDKNAFKAINKINLNRKYKIYNNFNIFEKIFKKKIDYTMSSIVGIDGLYPTLKIIKYSKNIAIANKESIICGWNLLKKELIKTNTNFIPVDSEHFSIWSSVNFSPFKIEKVYLTASGGPFYKNKFKILDNVSVNQALKHPTWKMGKKITIDSATLMNKIFEVIEAKKIFNIDYKKIGILIHPSSYIHAIIKFNNGLINVIAHETTMKVPIFNSLYHVEKKKLKTKLIDIKKMNSINLSLTNTDIFPTLKILKKMPMKDSLFETALVSANDYLVNLFLEKKISFKQISNLLLKILKMKKFIKLKHISPKNLNEIFETKKYTINCIQQLIHNHYV